MSDEGQDVELRVLVAQTLENNGVLSKIRAELRASVFLALEDQEDATKSHILNKPLKDFVSSVEGSLILSLVRELLEFFDLKHTLSVFDPETNYGKEYCCSGRNQLLKDLKIQNLNNSKKGPLIVQILRLAQSLGLTSDENDADTSAKGKHKNVEDKLSNHINSVHSIGEEKSQSHSTTNSSNHLNSNLSPLFSNHINIHHNSNTSNPPSNLVEADDISNRSLPSSHSIRSESISNKLNDRREEVSNISPHLNNKTVDTNKPSLQENSLLSNTLLSDVASKEDLVKQQGKMSLLGNLPPLTNPGKVHSVEENQGKNLNQLNKALLDLGIDSPDNYDEDFHSSVSGSIKDDADKGSGSEVEEDIFSNQMEDQVIQDLTLSNASGVGDYMEDAINGLDTKISDLSKN